jgi:hypothetical protein
MLESIVPVIGRVMVPICETALTVMCGDHSGSEIVLLKAAAMSASALGLGLGAVVGDGVAVGVADGVGWADAAAVASGAELVVAVGGVLPQAATRPTTAMRA